MKLNNVTYLIFLCLYYIVISHIGKFMNQNSVKNRNHKSKIYKKKKQLNIKRDMKQYSKIEEVKYNMIEIQKLE